MSDISGSWDSSFGKSAGLVIERLRVRIPARAALCVDSYSVSVPPVSPQWHVKDPGHSAKSAGGRLHLNTHTSLPQRSRSGRTMLLSTHSVGTYLERKLTHSLLWNIRPQSPQLAEPPWTEPGIKSGIRVRELISI